jgi:hypothetical protein
MACRSSGSGSGLITGSLNATFINCPLIYAMKLETSPLRNNAQRILKDELWGHSVQEGLWNSSTWFCLPCFCHVLQWQQPRHPLSQQSFSMQNRQLKEVVVDGLTA